MSSEISPPATPSRAGLWRRFGAFVHELLFLVAYLFIIELLFASLSGVSMSMQRPQILSGPVAILHQCYLFVMVGLYFIFFWIRGRRTLAFKTWQLRLVTASNIEQSATLKHAIIRYVAAWIGPALALLVFHFVGGKSGPLWFLALFANFLWAFIDRDRQFLHDRIAGTRVMYRRE